MESPLNRFKGRPLSELGGGQGSVVLGLAEGPQRARLLALGLLPGERVAVLSAEGGGPLLLAVRGSRLLLGREAAASVILE